MFNREGRVQARNEVFKGGNIEPDRAENKWEWELRRRCILTSASQDKDNNKRGKGKEPEFEGNEKGKMSKRMYDLPK